MTGTSGNNIISFWSLIRVDTSDGMFRVLSAIPMSEKPYRKAMVADFFYQKIKALVVNSAFFSVDLVATIAIYFDFNTSSAESEAVAAVDKISAAVFKVDYLASLGFRNQCGTPISCRPANLTYFDFCSVTRASVFDIRGPGSVFVFVLKLSQTLVNAAAPIVYKIASHLPTPITTTNTEGGSKHYSLSSATSRMSTLIICFPRTWVLFLSVSLLYSSPLPPPR